MIKVFAGIAHLVERSLAKAEVAGSSPVSRSNPKAIQRIALGLEESNKGARSPVKKSIRWIDFRGRGAEARSCARLEAQQQEDSAESPVSRSNPEPIRTVGSGLDRKACQRMEKFVLDKGNVCRYSVAVTH